MHSTRELWHFEVSRADLHRIRFAEAQDAPLESNQVRLAVDRFGFTANNITYAVAGDTLGYWKFFPAEEGWGRIPVWGFADVVESRHAEFHGGERIYGYWPISIQVVLEPVDVSAGAFKDASPHRTRLPGAYNLYTRCSGDPSYDTAHEGLQALWRPLFITSFLLDDWLREKELFGANAVLVSSASSKTALALAFLLRKNRASDFELIGLTSAANADFVHSTGYYDRVLRYEELDALPADLPAIYVDLAGSANLLSTVHERFTELKHSVSVGGAHWEEFRTPENLPGPKPEFFFAPRLARRRMKDWGSDGFAARPAAAWEAFLPSVEAWMDIQETRGKEAIEAVYRNTLAGRVSPREGRTLRTQL